MYTRRTQNHNVSFMVGKAFGTTYSQDLVDSQLVEAKNQEKRYFYQHGISFCVNYVLHDVHDGRSDGRSYPYDAEERRI